MEVEPSVVTVPDVFWAHPAIIDRASAVVSIKVANFFMFKYLLSTFGYERRILPLCKIQKRGIVK
jgi:hypothetical protein